MPFRLILSIGMPRAGSGWHYNLIHDLVVASGGQDARLIRKRYFLGPILTEVNCNIGALTPQRLLPVIVPILFGNTYTIKAHAGPKPLALGLIRRGFVRPTYIYRDPRDALLSAYEYGQRSLEAGRAGAFSHLTTIENAIDFMRRYVAISEAWLNCEEVLAVRYEDILTNYDAEIKRLLAFLDLQDEDREIQEVIDGYRPEKGHTEQKGTHFVKGKIGRFRQVLTPAQSERCAEVFGAYLQRQGYVI
jgi:hypothetical protein